MEKGKVRNEGTEKEDKYTHCPLRWELYLLWQEVNFQASELQEVSFSTDKDLGFGQGLYTDQNYKIQLKTSLYQGINLFLQLNPGFYQFWTGFINKKCV